MTNILQAFKLQIASSYKLFVVDYLVSIIAIILMKIFNAGLEYFAIVFIFEIAFSLIMGYFNYSIPGDTYYALKHDRHHFLYSTAMLMVINAFIVSLIFMLIPILLKAGVKVMSLLLSFLIISLAYLLGSLYSLYISRIKFVNIIFIIVLLVTILIIGAFIKNLFVSLTDLFVNYNSSSTTSLITIIVLLVVIAGCEVLTCYKYLTLKK